MRVFGLNAGRSGSATFVVACGHATNYTVGHETFIRKTPLSARLTYPDQHIEADNRLSLMLGALGERYPTDVFYVHLRRDPEAVAASWASRMPDNESWAAWIRNELGLMVRRQHRSSLAVTIGHQWFGPAHRMSADGMVDAALAYVEMTTANIREFLHDRPHVALDVDEPAHGLAETWERAGVEGDFDAALTQYGIRHNAGVPWQQ